MADKAQVGSVPISSGVFLEVGDYLERAALQYPDCVAVEVPHQSSEHLRELLHNDSNHIAVASKQGHLKWTYAQLYRASSCLAAVIFQFKSTVDGVVASFTPCGIETPLMMWACSLAGMTLSTIDRTALLSTRIDQLVGTLRQLKPTLIIALSEDEIPIIQRAIDLAALPQKPTVLHIFGTTSLSSQPSLLQLLSSQASRGCNVTLPSRATWGHPSRTAFIVFSSGTSSGFPKGCQRSASCVVQYMHHAGHINPFSSSPESIRSLIHTAVFRSVAITLFTGTWARGGTTVLLDSPTPSSRIEAIISHHITNLFLAPTIVHELTSVLASQPRDMPSVQFVTLSGEVVTIEHLQHLRKLFPASVISAKYGCTEGDASVAWPPAWLRAGLETIPTFEGMVSMGRVSPGAMVRICNDMREVVPWGKQGELHMHCATMISDYLGGWGEEYFYEDNDGRWFRTGDRGLIDTAGNIFVLGRIKDIIRRASIPINPAGLERCIDSFTGSQSTVVAVPDELLGEVPYAVVRDLGGRTREEICQQIVDVFGEDLALGGAVELEQLGIKTFPVNATGKTLKRAVVPLVFEYLERTKRG